MIFFCKSSKQTQVTVMILEVLEAEEGTCPEILLDGAFLVPFQLRFMTAYCMHAKMTSHIT